MDENVRRSCRICQSPNQDNDFECLYLHNDFLSVAGQLYEELFGIQIENGTFDYYPQYLCNSCELQMKLFKKLKAKAHKTMRLLQKLYAEINIESSVNKTIIIEEEEEEEEAQYLDEANEEILEEECTSQNNLQLFETTTVQFSTDETSLEANNDEVIEVYSKTDTIAIETLDNATHVMNEKDDNDDNAEFYCSDDEQTHVVVLCNEEDSLNDDATEDDQDIYTNSNYLNNVNEKCSNTRNCRKNHRLETKFKCYTCSLEFEGRRELTKHRKCIHFNKFMCPQCPKLLQSADSLRVHIQLHEGKPAYKCQLCQKTFNQKVHYKYHMNKHNNVRNFKCDHCDKAFISKSDLSIHMRTHTGERRYECDICGKDFLIYQHMKMHRYSHLGKSLQCEICKQKFTSPSTLHTHVKTIHATEPQFQCEYCIKKFRRKHHLTAHYRVHQKNKNQNCTEQVEVIQAQILDNNFMQTICIEDDDNENVDKNNDVEPSNNATNINSDNEHDDANASTDNYAIILEQ